MKAVFVASVLLVALSVCSATTAAINGSTPVWQWQSLPMMPKPVYSAQAAYVDGFIYFLGGVTDEYAQKYNWRFAAGGSNSTNSTNPPNSPISTKSASLPPLHPAPGPQPQLAQQWDTALTPLPFPVAKGGAALANGVIFLIQGSQNLAYTPSQDIFHTVPGLPNSQIEYPAVTSTAGDLVLAIGGISLETQMPVASVQAFNVSQGRWTTMNRLPTARGAAAIATDLQGFVHVLGGFNGKTVLNTHEVFDAVNNRWMSLPPLPVPMAGAAAVVTQDNKLYVLGGSDQVGNALITVFVMDLSTNVWSKAPQLPGGNTKFLNAVAVGTSVYLMGGCNGVDQCIGGGNAQFYALNY